MENVNDYLNNIKLSISSYFINNINNKIINTLDNLKVYEDRIENIENELFNIIDYDNSDKNDIESIIKTINEINDYKNHIHTTYSQILVRSRILIEICKSLALGNLTEAEESKK